MTTKTERASGRSSNAGDEWRWCVTQIWQGMTLPVWTRLLFDNRFSVSPSRWLSLLLTTGCSISNSLLRLLSEVIYSRRAAKTTVKPPLFIIGHWRTGTTLLHELLTLDNRFNFPSTFACMQPHHFPLTEPIGTRLSNDNHTRPPHTFASHGRE